jgi:hypothetical protein
MAEARTVNPLVEQFRKGGVPKPLRLMAAQGALPLKPVDLVELLHSLLGDADEEIRNVSSTTLGGLPAADLLPILKDKETSAPILAWALNHRSERELREAVLQNVTTPDEAIEAESPELPEELAELVVINQVRLLRRTTLLEALEANPHLNNDQRRRLRELRETFKIGQVEQAPPPPAPTPEAVKALTPEPPPATEEELHEELPPATEEEAVVRYLSEEERKETGKVSAVQKLYRMNTAEKIVTALKGSREERTLLIRDPNRLVSCAVLGSPRLTEAEVEAFAAMKNVSDNVLRIIGNNRDWIKKYNVLSSLVKNPRTPLAISIGMVARLNPRDMKSVSMDKNVPEAVRKTALRFVKAAQESGSQKH